jgi:uncharacterized membrane protein
MAGSTKASLFLGLGGIALVAIFLWAVFLSGDPLLTNDLWQLDPRRDYLVIIFPQGFWFDATMRVVASTVSGAVALTLA